jgi:hypothetical protein
LRRFLHFLHGDPRNPVGSFFPWFMGKAAKSSQPGQVPSATPTDNPLILNTLPNPAKLGYRGCS